MKKSQSSMEYLTVYGFGIIIIIGIVGTFAYLNSNPLQRVPNDCRFNAEIECIDYIISLQNDNSVIPNIVAGTNLYFKNNDETIYDVSLKCKYNDGSEKQGSSLSVVNSGDEVILSCPLPDSSLQSGQKLRVDLELMYHLNLTSFINWRNFDGVIITNVRDGR